jgi:hypothetical protein
MRVREGHVRAKRGGRDFKIIILRMIHLIPKTYLINSHNQIPTTRKLNFTGEFRL